MRLTISEKIKILAANTNFNYLHRESYFAITLGVPGRSTFLFLILQQVVVAHLLLADTDTDQNRTNREVFGLHERLHSVSAAKLFVGDETKKETVLIKAGWLRYSFSLSTLQIEPSVEGSERLIYTPTPQSVKGSSSKGKLTNVRKIFPK